MNQINTQAGVALVTGSARRIGAEIIRHLHAANYDVIIHYHHSAHEAEHLAQTLNRLRKDSARALQANLMIESETRQLIQSALAWQQRLDVLVNNASLFLKDNLGAHVLDDLMTVHVKAPMQLSEEAFDSLKEHQGAIINITDIHAEKPLKQYGYYCQSKAALKMQTEYLARAYAPNIRVNAVAPGAILWPEEYNNILDDKLKLKIIDETPLKTHGDPKWIAMAVCDLVKNAFITGQTLRVDGGRSVI